MTARGPHRGHAAETRRRSDDARARYRCEDVPLTLRSEGAHVLIYVCLTCLTTKAVLAEGPSSCVPACPFCGHSRSISVRSESDRVSIYESACGILHAATTPAAANG
jgi:hypothetical protein